MNMKSKQTILKWKGIGILVRSLMVVLCVLFSFSIVVGHGPQKKVGAVKEHENSQVVCKTDAEVEGSAEGGGEGGSVGVGVTAPIEGCSGGPGPIVGGHDQMHKINKDVEGVSSFHQACVEQGEIMISNVRVTAVRSWLGIFIPSLAFEVEAVGRICKEKTFTGRTM